MTDSDYYHGRTLYWLQRAREAKSGAKWVFRAMAEENLRMMLEAQTKDAAEKAA